MFHWLFKIFLKISSLKKREIFYFSNDKSTILYKPLISMVYTLGEEAEFLKICTKIVKQTLFFIEILSKYL